MAFPTGYSSTDPYLYLALVHPAVDDGNLYLCVIDDVGGDSEAEGLLAVEDDICSVEVYGEVILAGALGYGSNYMGVYRSDNGGDTFDFIDGPSGETNAYVYMMPGVFSATEGTAFCTSTGDNSALSRSTDGGQTWTQIGLIDVDIDTVIDVAFITQGAEQEALLITRDIPYRSLWRTDDITAANVVWERLIISPYAATEPI